jgi:hypothetical protein
MMERTSRSHAKRPRIEDHNVHDTPIPKPRVRVSEACDPCRKRKDRCDGCRPTCDNCLRTGRACSYRLTTRKRGLRTGYVRALETLLGLLFITVQGIDPWLSSLLEGQETTPVFQLRHLESPPAGDSIEPLLDAWRKSLVSKQIEHILSPADSIDEDEGAESNNAFDRRASQAVGLVDRILRAQMPTNNDTLPVFPPTPATNDTEPIAGHRSGEADNSPIIVLPTNWQHLLDLYFASTHCWLPISQKHDLLRSAYILASSSGDPAISASLSQADLAFLMAALTYASLQAQSQVTDDTLNPINTCKNLARSLSATTESLFPEQPGAYELGHVRALLVLALIQIHHGNQKGTWSAIGRAVYAVTSLEGVSFQQHRAEAPLNDGTKRTVLCCMALDSLVAAWVRVRPYFRRSDITAIGPLPTEGIEEWEPWKPTGTSNSYMLSHQTPARVLSTFNCFAEFVGILNDTLSLSLDGQNADGPRMSRQSMIDWTERLTSLHPISSPSNTTPQDLNLHWFAASLLETMQIHLTNGKPDLDVAHLRKLASLLQAYSRDMGKHLIPPTCNIHIFTLRISIDHKAQSQCGVGAELQGVQSFLLELDQLQPKTAVLPEVFLAVDLSLPSSQWNTIPPTEPSIDAPMLSLPYQAQPVVTDDMDFDPITGDTNFEPIIGFMPGEMDGDLFQSLAALDSTDWYAWNHHWAKSMLTNPDRSANPPDFMKHLGVMNDFTADLNTFFDQNPN